jgi:hypothetical protein
MLVILSIPACNDHRLLSHSDGIGWTVNTKYKVEEEKLRHTDIADNRLFDTNNQAHDYLTDRGFEPGEFHGGEGVTWQYKERDKKNHARIVQV